MFSLGEVYTSFCLGDVEDVACPSMYCLDMLEGPACGGDLFGYGEVQRTAELVLL